MQRTNFPRTKVIHTFCLSYSCRPYRWEWINQHMNYKPVRPNLYTCKPLFFYCLNRPTINQCIHSFALCLSLQGDIVVSTFPKSGDSIDGVANPHCHLIIVPPIKLTQSCVQSNYRDNMDRTYHLVTPGQRRRY